MKEEAPQINHIIGCARTIQTAILVVEYLRKRYSFNQGGFHPDAINYRFKDPTPINGFWSADIVVTTHSAQIPDLTVSVELVETCRAFVAGRGEVWI